MKNYFVIFLIISLLGGCGQKDSLLGIVSIPEYGWPYEPSLEFQFRQKQDDGPLDMLYQLQYEPEFSSENIWLSYLLKGPAGDTIIRSTDNLFLFQPGSGKPLGSGCRERFFITAFFLKGIRLKDTGTYRLYIRHQMRDDTLKGVQALGIRLKKSSEG